MTFWTMVLMHIYIYRRLLWSCVIATCGIYWRITWSSTGISSIVLLFCASSSSIVQSLTVVVLMTFWWPLPSQTHVCKSGLCRRHGLVFRPCSSLQSRTRWCQLSNARREAQAAAAWLLSGTWCHQDTHWKCLFLVGHHLLYEYMPLHDCIDASQTKVVCFYLSLFPQMQFVGLCGPTLTKGAKWEYFCADCWRKWEEIVFKRQGRFQRRAHIKWTFEISWWKYVLNVPTSLTRQLQTILIYGPQGSGKTALCDFIARRSYCSATCKLNVVKLKATCIYQVFF